MANPPKDESEKDPKFRDTVKRLLNTPPQPKKSKPAGKKKSQKEEL